MNTNNGLPSGWTVMQQPKWKPYALQSLIDTNPYPTALAKLQKQKEDCGYTDKWYQDELRKMNKEWRNKVQSAIEENSRYIDEQRAEIAKVRATNFEHRYTERDYADLQFMQNLIKTRIAAEGQNNGVLIGRIVDDYINTQVGARAIMFLSGDSEVGKLLQDYYAFREEDHRELCELVSKCKRKWIVTYDICPLVADLYHSYRSSYLDVTYSIQSSKKAKEYIFFSDNLTLPESIELRE